MKSAVVIGASGQDGTILCEQLTGSGTTVLRWLRGAPDVQDAAEIARQLRAQQPTEIYYLAAHHHSSEGAADSPAAEFEAMRKVQVDGLLNVLEGIRTESPTTRLFYASSSHIFGSPKESPQTENTPFHPVAPYGITKTAGMGICRFYRERYGVFASVGILYNHESRLRREQFVTQKIIQAAKRIRAGSKERIVLGDICARVDWGYAPDYVRSMQLILQLDRPDDFVVATGKTHSVEEFAELTFSGLGLDWRDHVDVNPSILREKRLTLTGSPEKLMQATGWKPTVTFAQMIQLLLKDE